MCGKVRLYEGEKASWHFVLLPKGLSQNLKVFFAGAEGGFGSLPVEVTVGQTTWRTSIFPESKKGHFFCRSKRHRAKRKEFLREIPFALSLRYSSDWLGGCLQNLFAGIGLFVQGKAHYQQKEEGKLCKKTRFWKRSRQG